MTDPAVVFIYMDFRTAPTVQQLFGSLARQIVAEMVSIHRDVQTGWKDKASRGKTESGQYGQPSQEYLEQLLSKLTENRPLYVIIDAMDECRLDIRQDLLDKVKKISKDVRILVTARLLEKRDELSEGFQMETIQAHPSDIEEYINSRINKSSLLLRGPRDLIRQHVARKGGGMFLLVKLHMLALDDLDEPEEIEQALKDLPKTVDGSYEDTMKRINSTANRRKNYARKIFAWISYAYRPLTAKELSHAIATPLHKTVSKKETLLSKEKITSFCCGLVEVDSDDVVRFIHYSAEQFFKDRKGREYPEFTREIPLSCAKYLCMISPERQGALRGADQFIEDRTMSEKLELFSFASYAANYLHEHFQSVRHQSDTDLYSAIDDLINNEAKRNFYYRLLDQSNSYFTRSALLDKGESHERNFSFRGQRYMDSDADESDEDEPQDRTDDPNSHSLHLATFLGHAELVKRLIERGSVTSELDTYSQDPLTIALKRDFGDIAEVLLDNGALVDLSQQRGHVVLLYAAQRNFESAVEKILGREKENEYIGSFIDLIILLISPLLLLLYICRAAVPQLAPSPPSEPQAPIPAESEDLGRYSIVLTLAYRGETENLENFLVNKAHNLDEGGAGGRLKARDFFNTACFLAVERGHTEIVKLLLKFGVAADIKNFHKQPLLHRAVSRNHIGLVKLLLENGAPVDLTDSNGRTAYTAHADKDHKEVLNILRDYHANVHHTDVVRVHELYRAAAFGNIEMVRFFLEAGVSASITNRYSWTPLHEASANGHLECVQLLFEYNADPSPISDVGKTPLDLVKSGKPHYDWPCLGNDSEHYLNGEKYKEKQASLEDLERLDEIKQLLEAKGAKTADQLYAIDQSRFKHVAAGPYSRSRYISWGNSQSETGSDSDDIE
ncbi:hypothetical protein ANO14919_135420 [Xylariales sp. No.14919]|nr:hypothetical protein ANO14919_135420 [Xylariales sp. No.14919]